MACIFEEEAPTVKETVNIYPTIDVDDDEEDYVDVPDDEPVMQDADDDTGNGNKKWGNEPQVGVQQRYVWQFQRRIQYEVGKKIKIFETKWLLNLLRKTKWRIPADDAPEVAKR